MRKIIVTFLLTASSTFCFASGNVVMNGSGTGKILIQGGNISLTSDGSGTLLFNPTTCVSGACTAGVDTSVVPRMAASNTWTGTNNFVNTVTLSSGVTISSGIVLGGSTGTNGQVLSSQGPGLAPQWQNSGSGTTITSTGSIIVSFNWNFQFANAGHVTLSSNTLYCFAVPAISSVRLSSMSFYSFSGLAASSGTQMGIYDYSGALISSTTVLIGSSGANVQTTPLKTPVTLTQGTGYNFCMGTQENGTLQPDFLNFSASNDPQMYNISNPMIYTCANPASGLGASFALPTTCGARTAVNAAFPYMQAQP